MAAAWGFAEATVFFIVPDARLSAVSAAVGGLRALEEKLPPNAPGRARWSVFPAGWLGFYAEYPKCGPSTRSP